MGGTVVAQEPGVCCAWPSHLLIVYFLKWKELNTDSCLATNFYDKLDFGTKPLSQVDSDVSLP